MAIHTGSVGATFLSPGNSDGSKYIGHVAEESGRGRESSLAAGNYKMKFVCMFEKVSLYHNKHTYKHKPAGVLVCPTGVSGPLLKLVKLSRLPPGLKLP